MTDDTKLASVRFVSPVELPGMGMAFKIDVSTDPETGLPFNGSVAITLLAGGLWVRITTPHGAALSPASNVTSAKVLFVDRLVASKAAKAAK